MLVQIVLHINTCNVEKNHYDTLNIILNTQNGILILDLELFRFVNISVFLE